MDKGQQALKILLVWGIEHDFKAGDVVAELPASFRAVSAR
jgi:hypothetical protein